MADGGVPEIRVSLPLVLRSFLSETYLLGTKAALHDGRQAAKEKPVYSGKRETTLGSDLWTSRLL